MSSSLTFSPRQMLLLIGAFYFSLGYCSGSYLRMIAASLIVIFSLNGWVYALKIIRYFSRIPFIVRLLLCTGGVTLYVLNATMMPAHAVFLTRLCGLLVNVVNIAQGGAGTGATGIDVLIKAIVNVLRGVFIIYLVIALVNVFNQIQRDEEWGVAVRAPILAIVIIGIVEAISSLVVPSGVGTC